MPAPTYLPLLYPWPTPKPPSKPPSKPSPKPSIQLSPLPSNPPQYSHEQDNASCCATSTAVLCIAWRSSRSQLHGSAPA
ncbi:hypothetical protein CDD81_5442 [Ophiocordyceps australis]|uniref:Uncharacterized protein n=1 Tax=Ophiocordyceps australis TaxID=1399860 RepID=A0A2C5Y2S8_9HYPO|nr:hypothetical protein CDD81_5442 [Ophiocordyceps australis]